MKLPILSSTIWLVLACILPRWALAAPVAVAKTAIVAGPTALPALSVSSGTPTSYSITYVTTSAGALYVGSTQLAAGTTTVALADISRLRFVPTTDLTTTTTVSFTYAAIDASGSSSAKYTLTVLRASTLDFSTRTSAEDWSAGRSVTVDNATITGSTFTYSSSATVHTLAIGNPSSRLPGTALAWGSTYGTTTSPGTDGANNTSTYTFTFAQPVYYLSLTLTDIDAGTYASNQSDFTDDVTAYPSASSTTAITYDNVSMATAVNPTTTTVARTAASNNVKGTANNNATAYGTVLVSFASAVQRFTITYKNTAAYTSGNSRIQNLGIPSMTWAYSLTPLPVTLTAFTAQASSNGTVELAWTTASETNNDHFEVERSADGTEFTRLSSVAGQGNLTTAHSYSFTDATVPATLRLAYYRLRQVDLDGTATYSPVRAVQVGTPTAVVALSCYPNPTTGTVTLDLSQWPVGTYQAQLFHISGRQQLVFAVQGGQANSLSLESQAAGCYLLRVAGAQSSSAIRVIKQ